jgi:hypothetical protein
MSASLPIIDVSTLLTSGDVSTGIFDILEPVVVSSVIQSDLLSARLDQIAKNPTQLRPKLPTRAKRMGFSTSSTTVLKPL